MLTFSTLSIITNSVCDYKLMLRMPPSCNRMWRAVFKRNRPFFYLHNDVVEYYNYVKNVVVNADVIQLSSKSKIKFYAKFVFNNRRKQDLDNRLKVLIDALTKANCWVDDSQIYELHAVKAVDTSHDFSFVNISYTS